MNARPAHCNHEDFPCCGCGETLAMSETFHEHDEHDWRAGHEPEHGWPGDGSGEDDLADMNANEADDYSNEGDSHYYEDEGLDSSWEDRFESGE